MTQTQTTVTQQNSDYYTPQNQFGSAILYLTNPEDLIEQLKLTMRSQYLDDNGMPVSYGEPLANELGIATVISQLRSIVNQVTIMSNLESRHEESLRNSLARSLNKNLMLNRIKYDMSDDARDIIFDETIRIAVICIRRAYESGERRFWKGQQPQEVRTVMEGQTGGKKGGLLKFIGWGK